MSLKQESTHHVSEGLEPQTPIDSSTPIRFNSPVRQPKISPWISWAIEPAEAFKLLLIPIVLYVNWELLTPRLETILKPWAPSISQHLPSGHLPNPFAPMLFISGRIPTSDPADPRYAKTYYDLLFLAYNIVFFSFFRQLVTVVVFKRIAQYFGIKKEAKLARFGEQGYAVVYFFLSGAWGMRIMSELPTWWYRTEYFWIDYPHWDMKPELKRYYLMQMAYWCQQLIVLALRLEKPRKDYYELIAHHIVTLWMVGWSYLINLTYIGVAVYMSMDIPDMGLAFSKLLNYLQLERAKVVSFAIFVCLWTYFRHYLNLVILWSVWNEFHLIPERAQRWEPSEGVWLVWWMKYQIFPALSLLQLLNLFWYYLILRIVKRSIMESTTDDDRSDDEDEEEEPKPKSKSKPAEKKKVQTKEKETKKKAKTEPKSAT